MTNKELLDLAVQLRDAGWTGKRLEQKLEAARGRLRKAVVRTVAEESKKIRGERLRRERRLAERMAQEAPGAHPHAATARGRGRRGRIEMERPLRTSYPHEVHPRDVRASFVNPRTGGYTDLIIRNLPLKDDITPRARAGYLAAVIADEAGYSYERQRELFEALLDGELELI